MTPHEDAFFLEIGAGIDSEDVANLAEELALNPLVVADKATAVVAWLEEAAHYAALSALRDALALDARP